VNSFTGWTNSNSNLGWGPDDLTYQGKFGDDDNTTIHNLTISQLSAGQTYELIFYFSDAFPNETMTAEGAGPDTFGESKITTGGETYVEGAAAGIFSYFNNVTADGSGNIEVLASGSGRETITGFQLRAVAVPEPSTTALLGLGGLALILRRRK
ncbi:PEP-CTERM sorting domain-containing protein, partial [Rubritalea profundi]